MEVLEMLSPIKAVNEQLKQKDIKKFKSLKMTYKSHLEDDVSLEITLNEGAPSGVLKMETKKSMRNIVLRVLVMPGTGLSHATPIQLGDGLRKVVLSEFGLSSNEKLNKLKIHIR